MEEGQETVTMEIRTPSPTDVPPPAAAANQPQRRLGRRDDPRKRSYSNPVMLRRESTEVEFETYDYRRNQISNKARKFGRIAVSLCVVFVIDPPKSLIHVFVIIFSCAGIATEIRESSSSYRS